MKTAIVFFAMLFCGSLLGQEITAVDVSDVDSLLLIRSGQLYTITFDGGTPSIHPLKVIKPDSIPSPTPVPQPSNLTERAKAIKATADKVTGDASRSETAESLAFMYQAVADQIKDGTISDYKAAEVAATMAANLTLAGVSSQWKPVRDVFNSQWVKLTQEGGQLPDYEKLLREASAGLSVSADLQQLDPAKIAKLLDFLRMILEFINTLNATDDNVTPLELETNG